MLATTEMHTLDYGLDGSVIGPRGQWDFSDGERGGEVHSDSFPFAWTADEMGRIVRALVARKGAAK